MKTKVCMLVAHHPFLDARIFKKEAKSLLKQGYDVTMVVPRKKGYLFDIDGTPFTDRYLKPTFVHEGIHIVTYEDRREKLEQMSANVKSGRSDSFFNPLTKVGLAQQADIYHAHELLSLYSGIGIKRAMSASGKKVKLIYDSHEINPDPFEEMNKDKRKTLQHMLNRMVLEVDYIITVSEAIKVWYLTRNPLLPVEVIYNSPPLAENYKQKMFDTSGLIVCHEGNITQKKGNSEKLLGITNECSKEIDFKFKIIGGARGAESLLIPASLKKKVVLTGWVDYYSIPKHMKDVDVGWLHFDTTHSLNRSFALPNKFFSYLNNGVPVVVNKCHEMENFIRTYRCGLVIDKVNPTAEDYAKAFLYLYKRKDKLLKMSANARAIMEKKYSWEHMEKRLFDVYDRLLRPKTRYIM